MAQKNFLWRLLVDHLGRHYEFTIRAIFIVPFLHVVVHWDQDIASKPNLIGAIGELSFECIASEQPKALRRRTKPFDVILKKAGGQLSLRLLQTGPMKY